MHAQSSLLLKAEKYPSVCITMVHFPGAAGGGTYRFRVRDGSTGGGVHTPLALARAVQEGC